MSDKQLLQRAWDALAIWKETYPEGWDADDERLLDDLLTRIAQPEREWQGLTDEEGYAIFEEARHGSDRPIGVLRGIRAIEAKLREKLKTNG